MQHCHKSFYLDFGHNKTLFAAKQIHCSFGPRSAQIQPRIEQRMFCVDLPAEASSMSEWSADNVWDAFKLITCNDHVEMLLELDCIKRERIL